jgi:hypothetical protein
MGWYQRNFDEGTPVGDVFDQVSAVLHGIPPDAAWEIQALLSGPIEVTVRWLDPGPDEEDAL